MFPLSTIGQEKNVSTIPVGGRSNRFMRTIIDSSGDIQPSAVSNADSSGESGFEFEALPTSDSGTDKLPDLPVAWSLEMNDLSMIDDEMQVIDTIDQSYWNGKFVPPPPRPPFLEESIAPDGLTTCDLCSWAWQDKGTLSLDGAIKEIFSSSDTKEFNWTFALIVVSLTSALLGAIIMIVFLRCKRIRTNQNRLRTLCFDTSSTKDTSGLNFDNQTSKNSTNGSCSPRSTNSGLWTWFSSRKNLSTPDQLVNSHTLPVENHYTHMDDNNYNPVQIDEASYAEVGNETGPSSETTFYKSGSVHQGTDNDILIMNCPLPAIPTGSHSASGGGASGSGSAYYSGLLNNANMAAGEDEDERPYEIVDLKEMSSPHKTHNVQSHLLNETNNLLTIEKHSEALPEGTISASDYV
ncbi:uncharacterized protein LOC131294258 [Anopheles ziemanni]|uniref:uncharacterized protein LOC131264949 n=1 Tax=Anopheles coustani TaxID=139045 RepID=UPI0026595248|nr:uncharacterized protein LOC131264949 [Anopheles coustani]XP_058178287.1 uncharacterized protein LOC131294258 [Anopheles ziemanni]